MLRPQQSDLVLTGAAASEYRHRSGSAFQSVAHVLRTRQMVRLDWKRSVDNPALLLCLRSTFEKNAKAQNLRIVSVRRVRFPRLATFSAAYRVEIDVRAAGRRLRVLSDIVLLGRVRTEITLTGRLRARAGRLSTRPRSVSLAAWSRASARAGRLSTRPRSVSLAAWSRASARRAAAPADAFLIASLCSSESALVR